MKVENLDQWSLLLAIDGMLHHIIEPLLLCWLEAIQQTSFLLSSQLHEPYVGLYFQVSYTCSADAVENLKLRYAYI